MVVVSVDFKDSDDSSLIDVCTFVIVVNTPVFTLEVTGCDTVEVTGCDTVDVKGCDTVEVTSCDSVEVTGCDTVDVKGCDTVDVTVCDTVEVTSCDSVDVSGWVTVVTEAIKIKYVVMNIFHYNEQICISQEINAICLHVKHKRLYKCTRIT